MRIQLNNCDINLKTNFGIDMQTIGAYERLCAELTNVVPCDGIEYDFQPLDYIFFDVEDGTLIPDLSQFGEVQPYDNFIR